MGNVKASKIAEFLHKDLIGNDFIVTGVSPLNSLKNDHLTFSKSKVFSVLNIQCLMIVPEEFVCENNLISYIKVKNPRLSFAKIVQNFFSEKPLYEIDSSSVIGENCKIPDNIQIGANCVIGKNVVIGEKTIINSNVVISDNTIIGSNCYIKSGSIIGEDGFGFELQEDGIPIRIPHLGNVEIGNNVEIGAKNTIAKGTLGPHNCCIGVNTIITACAEISGSVSIGKNCWVGPNSSIIQKVKIGDYVTIGIGSIITYNIENNKKVMGLNALELRKLVKLKKRIKYDID